MPASYYYDMQAFFYIFALMAKVKLTSADFNNLGIYDLELIKKFGRTGKKLIKSGSYDKDEVLSLFQKLIENPGQFQNRNDALKPLAEFVINSSISFTKKENPEKENKETLQIRNKPLYYKIYGREQIETEAIEQMDTAMQLSVSQAGALMPDAHVGYGLPIGGVLATKNNIVIPYAVGVDIACRMCMSVFDINELKLKKRKEKFKKALLNSSVFGVGCKTEHHTDTSLFDKNEWQATKLIRDLKDLAYSQHGTSGAGNHFVEWGVLEVQHEDELLNIPKGKYVALLSHSGSRGFGAQIAKFYSDIAKQKLNLPQGAKHLSWLDLNSEEGIEYWIAMNLAGDYASDNHHEIHKKICEEIGLEPIKTIENHHNFAWKEKLEDGTEVIIHRKGATPAGKNDIGIIPGSMTHPGYVIRGKSNASSLNSASHGAGRVLSRKKAIKTISQKDLNILVENAGIELIGGHVDESPAVYKNIDKVMSYQKDLVEILAKFTPKIVRMAEPERWKK